MKKLTLLVIAFVVAFASYGQKQIKQDLGAQKATVFNNADYKPRSFKKIIVYTASVDEKINEKMLEELSGLGPIVNSLRIVPPVKEYTEDELKKLYEDNGIDGVIKFEVTGEDYVLTSRIVKLKVTMIDLKNNINAVTFVGDSSVGALNMNKAMVKFTRLIFPELKAMVL